MRRIICVIVGLSSLAHAQPRLELSPSSGLRAATDHASVELHLAAWFRAELLETEPGAGVSVPFSVPLLRPWVRASLLDGRLRLLLQPELARNPRLLDLHVDIQIASWVSLRAGQFRTPFSRAYVNPIIALAMTDRGMVSDEFRLDRDTGLMLFGQGADALLEYQLAVVDGAHINDLAGDVRAPTVVGRLVLNIGKPIGYDQAPRSDGRGLAIGAATAYRRLRDVSAETVSESWHVGGEMALALPRVLFLGESMLRRRRTGNGSWHNDWGAYAQASVLLVKDAWDISARVSRMHAFGVGTSSSVDVATQLYWWRPALGHHAKLQLQYSWLDHPNQREHRGTAQVQMSF